MRLLPLLAALFSLTVLPAAVSRGDAPAEPKGGHPFVCADFSKGKLYIISAKGEIEWEYPAKTCLDVWALANGNILLVSRGGTVQEVTRDRKVVFEYKPTGGEVYNVQRLPSGNTFLTENGAKRIIEVDAAGKIQKAVAFQTAATEHNSIRQARALGNGNYLLCQKGDNAVREYDPQGKIVWEAKAPTPFAAVRLASGNTLISCCTGNPAVIEVDRAGKTVWQLDKAELPDIKLGFAAGLQRLPNGNTVLCNGRSAGPLLIEFTPDKKVVWKYENAALSGVLSFQLLDVPGDAAKGEVLR